MDEVFDYDFNRCQFIKDAKTPEVLAEIKEILRPIYRKMLDLEILLIIFYFLGWTATATTPPLQVLISGKFLKVLF